MIQTAYDPEALRRRYETVCGRIAMAATKSSRDVGEIKVIAISKGHPVSMIRIALEACITNVGENRVQEAEAKILELGHQAAHWHLVGHLQPNKARRAVRLFECIHSLDSVALTARLQRICVEEKRDELGILIQVDLGGEETKSGVIEADLPLVVQELEDSSRLRFIGLMTLPPFFDNPERTRPYFRRLRELRDALKSNGHFGPGPGELSIGMSHDFEVAVEEGATMLRIGTAIFGERAQPNEQAG
jgi:pyridoxal phosphate enzyme (YggS family)